MDDELRELDLQLAEAIRKVNELNQMLSHRVDWSLKIKSLAQKQRNNQELWKPPMTAFGFEMQQALRDLHIAILGN